MPDPSLTPQVSVLIPAYNEEALISQVINCVHFSFEKIKYDSFEIIVCDNNSADRTAELAASKGARVVFEPHNQIAKARNTAAKTANGKWLIFLDADTFLSPELLGKTLGCLNSGKIAAGGSVLKFDKEKLNAFAVGLTWFWNRVSTTFALAAGSYLFCSREAWAEVGGFDEKLYAAEELFFSRKLKKWAKARGLKFKVIGDAPIVTSARKVEWYSSWQLMGRMLLMARPWAIRRRELCDLWYKRPPLKQDHHD